MSDTRGGRSKFGRLTKEEERKLCDRLLDSRYLGMDKRVEEERFEKERREADRRMYERRLEQFLEEHTGRCERLQMRITPDGCGRVRNRTNPPEECQYCPGVDMEERRVADRRFGMDRRKA